MAKSIGPPPFAARLKALRAAAGLTQQQLADALGAPQQTVARLEAGRRPDPRWSTVVALADALGVSTEAFRRK